MSKYTISWIRNVEQEIDADPMDLSNFTPDEIQDYGRYLDQSLSEYYHNPEGSDLLVGMY